MSDDLAQWLGEQLDDDERITRRVTTPGIWRVGRSHGGSTIEGGGWTVGSADELDAAHIARHDPARVLREIDAKRQIVNGYALSAQAVDELAVRREKLKTEGHDLFMTDMELESAIVRRDTLSGALRLLALPYADRPGYREEWRP
ncbi:DUF6221 family protein [Streptomyces sp. NPDC002853]